MRSSLTSKAECHRGPSTSSSASIRPITFDRRLTRLEGSLVARRRGSGAEVLERVETLRVQQWDRGQEL